MNQSNSETYAYLLRHYGPLLTLKHLAEVMHASPNGMRMAMARRRQPLAAALAQTKRQLGRRVYFEARLVAAVIDQGLTSKSLNAHTPADAGASYPSLESSSMGTPP